MSDMSKPGGPSRRLRAACGEPAPDVSAPPEDGSGATPLRHDPPRSAAADDEAGSDAAPRERHDAFTEARKAEFLTALVKTGCLLDAARTIGVSVRTIYRHQESDARFRDNVAAALRMSATPIELTAWQRAVEGVEQEFACGGQVHVRRRYDSGLLRLLLQGANPRKYGARPGFKRKRMLRHERKQMEKELRAEIRAEFSPAPWEEVEEYFVKRLKVLKNDFSPPGSGPAAENPCGHAGSGEEPPGDSM